MRVGSLLLIIWFITAGEEILAQEFRATLSGRVLDSAGAAIPGAQLRVTNSGTGENREVRTDDQGNYIVPLLNPAVYRVRVEAPGFKVALRDRLQLEVNQTATLDMKLELGDVKTEVTVTAEAPLLESANANRGGIVDEQSVRELPLNARNPFMLAMLAPGVNFDGELIYQRPFDNGAIAEWSINGSQRRNEFLIDGSPNNAGAGGNNVAFVPPVDSVQEFKIQTNSYDAQNGRSAGGTINVVLKSGQNAVHGTAYEFARRSAWDANSFQNNSRCLTIDDQGRCHGAPKDGHWLDQYGFQLSGPVYIPRLYDGHNKTFFTVNYERYREGTPQPLILSVPEPEMRKGDFSRLVDGRRRAITIYDPQSGQSVDGQWVRQPFAGNVIPKDRINPIALALIQYFPSPNTSTPGVNYSTANYFISGGDGAARDNFYNFVTKVDRNLGNRDHVFVRFGMNDRHEIRTYNGIFDKPGADGQLPLRRANWTGAVNYTSTLSSTLVLDVRASLSRYIDPSTAEADQGFDLVGAGFPTTLVSQLPFGSWFPRLSINPFVSLGRNPNFGGSATNTVALGPSINYFRGSKTWKAGADLRWTQYSTQNSNQIMYFSAGDTFTRADYQRSDSLSGAGLASWLLGLPTGGGVNISMFPIYMFPYYSAWAQHDWKVTSRLTLNFGLRWDLNVPPKERFNRVNRGFDQEAVNPVDGRIDHSRYPELSYPLRGGLHFAGVDGQPERSADLYWNTFQPRFGFAWSVARNTVIRGGWGRYFINPNNDYLQTTGFSANTALNVSADQNRTALPNLLSDPFPVVNQPAGSSRGLTTFLGNGFNFINTRFETPHMDSFSLDVQRALSTRSQFSVAYVGSRGRRLQSSKPSNEDDDSAIRDQCNYLLGATSQSYCTQNLPNPFKGVPGFEGTSFYTNNTRSRYDLSRPFPLFTSGLNELMRNDALSWYNAAQVTFNWRTRNGINISANYTFSKSTERRDYLDPMHDVMQQGLTGNDRPHKFAYSMIWQLPFGKGQRFFRNTRGITGKLISGWEATSIFQMFSGRPWALPGNVLYVKDARNAGFTWNAPRIQGVLPCVKSWNNNTTITWQSYSVDYGCTEANFIILPNYNPRYTPYYDGRIRMQTVRLLDGSFNKTTRISERYSLQYRLEGFNILNSFFMNNANYTNDPNNTNFGSVIKNTLSAGATNYPRQIQMAIKLIW